MLDERSKKIINFIKDFCQQRTIKINKIILFGSCARNNFSAESDMDIAIVSNDFEQKDIFKRTDMLKGLNWSLVERFMLPFDIVPISLSEWKESSSLIVEFVKQGKEVLSA